MTHSQHEPGRDDRPPGTPGGAGRERWREYALDDVDADDASTRRADPRHQQSWWSVVRVIDGEVVERAPRQRGEIESGDEPGAGPDTTRCRLPVRAYVHLGELTPADVHVDLLGGRLPAAEVRDRPEGVRLWSTESYGNGTFVFEGCATAEAGELDIGWTVRVRPAPGGYVGIPVLPVVGWFTPPPARSAGA